MDRELEKDLVHRADSSNRCMRMKCCESEWKEGGVWQERKTETARRNDPRTFEGRSHQVERWRVQEKRKEEKWKKKKKKVKCRKRKWWKKCKEHIISLSMMIMKRGKKEKERKRSERRPKARQTLETLGKWLFLLLIIGQHWLSVSAAAEGP